MTDILNSDWNAFLEVGLAGSVSKAAIRMRLRQPGLSRRLARLEASQGVKLFERTNRGVRLTIAGQRLFKALVAQREILSHLISEQLQLANEIQGQIRLGCHRSLALHYLPSLLNTLTTEHPKLRPDLHFTDSREVIHLIQMGSLDFGLVVDPKPSQDLVVRKLFVDSIGFFTSQESSKRKSSLLLYNPETVVLSKFKSVLRRSSSLAVPDYEVAAALAAKIPESSALIPADVAKRWGLHSNSTQASKVNIYLVYRSAMRGTNLSNVIYNTLAKVAVD